MSSMVPGTRIAALLTRMSIRPYCSLVCSKRLVMSSSWETSQRTPMASPPSSRMRLTAVLDTARDSEVAFVLGTGRDDHLGALTREHDSHVPADSPARSCNHCDFAI